MDHVHAQCRLAAGRWYSPLFLGVHPVRCRLAAPLWRGTVQALRGMLAWPVPLSGAPCMRHAQCEMLAQPVPGLGERTDCCNLRSMQPFESHCN